MPMTLELEEEVLGIAKLVLPEESYMMTLDSHAGK
jgi:hypothetical protein